MSRPLDLPAAPTTPTTRQPWLNWSAPLLALFWALAMNGLVGVALGLAALPITLFRTRDIYTALLSPSYGLAYAGETMQWVILGTVLFSFRFIMGWPAPKHSQTRRSITACLLGAVVGGLSAGGEVALVHIIPTRWHDGLITILGGAFVVAATAFGALAGLLAVVGSVSPLPVNATWQARLGTLSTPIWRFALVLAVLSQVTLATLDLIGRP